MFSTKAVALAALAAALARAQNTTTSNTTTTAATANTGANPLIPTTASAGCQNALASINGDPTLAACTAPLLAIVKAMDPSAGAGTSSGDLTALLNQTCSQSEDSACDDGYVRGLVRNLAGNCSAELSAGDPVVVANYDVLYVMQPFREAMCSVDSKTGAYCIDELADGTAPSSSGAITSSSSAATPNATASISSSDLTGNETTAIVSHAAAPAFDIGTYASDAMTPANLVVQFTNQNADSMLAKRQSSVALPSGAPSCATTCWTSKISEAGTYGLDATSAASLCSSADWIKSYTTCTSENCDSTDLDTANSAEQTLCSSSSSSTTTTGSSTTNTTSVTSQTASAPNATTFALTNLPFLFISTNMTSDFACTQCTKTVLLRYLQWESAVPYALGLAASPLLKGQTELWSGLSGMCGSGFTSSIEQGTGADGLSGAAAPTLARGPAAAALVAALAAFALL